MQIQCSSIQMAILGKIHFDNNNTQTSTHTAHRTHTHFRIISHSPFEAKWNDFLVYVYEAHNTKCVTHKPTDSVNVWKGNNKPTKNRPDDGIHENKQRCQYLCSFVSIHTSHIDIEHKTWNMNDTPHQMNKTNTQYMYEMSNDFPVKFVVVVFFSSFHFTLTSLCSSSHCLAEPVSQVKCVYWERRCDIQWKKQYGEHLLNFFSSSHSQIVVVFASFSL